MPTFFRAIARTMAENDFPINNQKLGRSSLCANKATPGAAGATPRVKKKASPQMRGLARNFIHKIIRPGDNLWMNSQA